MTFSVICVYNNKQILQKNLLSSLEKQNQKYQLILLNNTRHKFKSAAEALNFGAKKARGKYLMFVHQDVRLEDKNWLAKATQFLDGLKDLGIAGVVGMSESGQGNKSRGRNVIKHGEPPAPWSWGNPIKEPEVVQTLDECLLIVPRRVFDKLQFDEKTCNDWHLYGVDYCLSIKKLGFLSYVLPLVIYHQSAGSSFSDRYYDTLRKLLVKHKDKYKRIYTTMGNWRTFWPFWLQLFLKRAEHFISRGEGWIKSLRFR